MLCKVGHKEYELFKIRQVAKAAGLSNEAIRKKEARGMVPHTRFRNKQGERLYSIEDIAMFEYFYKHLWHGRQGIKVPEMLAELIFEAFTQVRKEVLRDGRLESDEILYELAEKYPVFDPGVLHSYILHWRSVLLESESSFIDDLMDCL